MVAHCLFLRLCYLLEEDLLFSRSILARKRRFVVGLVRADVFEKLLLLTDRNELYAFGIFQVEAEHWFNSLERPSSSFESAWWKLELSLYSVPRGGQFRHSLLQSRLWQYVGSWLVLNRVVGCSVRGKVAIEVF